MSTAKQTERSKCLLFTTFNDILNLYRARQWFGPDNVWLAIAHPFKVLLYVKLITVYTE